MSVTTISGNFVDQKTGKPLAGASINVFPDGNTNAAPFTVIQTDANGNFSYTNPDLPTWYEAVFVATAPGYTDILGAPENFMGTTQMVPNAGAVVADTLGGSGGWAFLIIIALGLLILFHYKKEIKL